MLLSCKEVSTVGQVFIANVLGHPDGLQKGSPVPKSFLQMIPFIQMNRPVANLMVADDNLTDNPVHPKRVGLLHSGVSG